MTNEKITVSVTLHPDGNVEVASVVDDKIVRLGILQAGIISVVFGKTGAPESRIATPGPSGRF